MRNAGTLTLAALLALALPAAAASRAAESLREDWLQKDREVFRAWSQDFDPAAPSPQALLQKLHVVASPTDRARPLGHGLEIVHGTRPGGYCSCTAHVLAHEGAVVQVKVTAACSAEAWPTLGALVPDAWRTQGRDLENDSRRGVVYVWTHDVRLAAARRAVAADLGEPEPAEVPTKLADSMEQLTSPFAHTDVSFRGGCYFGGTDPRGKKAMNTLVKANRWDLVRVVARGLNPEARVYAANALLTAPAKRRVPADGPLVERIRALTVPVSVCNGCLISSEKAAELLPAPPAP